MIRFSGVYSMMGKWSELCVEEVSMFSGDGL